MQLPKSNSFLAIAENNIISHQIEPPNQTISLTFAYNWIKQQIRHWRINQKIGYGYALAIGIAVLGTTAGMAIGYYHQKAAKEQLAYLQKKHFLLTQLKTDVLEGQLHQQRLGGAIGNDIWLRYESSEFNQNMGSVERLLLKIKYFVKSNSYGLAADKAEILALLKDYQRTTNAYTQLVRYILKQTAFTDEKLMPIEESQQVILRTISGEVTIKFDQLSQRLNTLINQTKFKQIEARERLIEAETLGRKITLISMVISVIIAAILAYYTSHAIARPLEAVTKVAQQVTKESNFSLQAPVTTEDEVGLLATSLNQLIERIGSYTLELKQTQAQLIQTEKMSSLGQIVAGVAHEINNPINFIYGNLDYAVKYMEELLELVNLYQQEYPMINENIQNYIEEIDLNFLAEDLPKILSSMQMGSNRIRQIVLSLRNFSRLEEADMKAVNIHQGIDSTLLILSHRLKDIEVVKNYGNLPLVECFPADLNQVFMNIISNAIDALLCEKKTPGNKIVIQTEKLGNNHIKVIIRDNGCGIFPEIRNKIFDPFFTTKSVGQGTGLGLYICYQIIQKHGGKIEVKSELGQGSEFAIALPIKANILKVPVGAGFN